jgi:hypothetical protein
MNVLRSVFWLVMIGCIISIFVLGFVALKHPMVWVLVLSQILVSYFMTEIVHTTHAKFKPPEPTSLVFNKEMLSRYKG